MVGVCAYRVYRWIFLEPKERIIFLRVVEVKIVGGSFGQRSFEELKGFFA